MESNVMYRITYSFNMNSFSFRFSETEAKRIHQQCGNTQQLHSRSYQTGCDHVVHKERPIVR